MILNYSFLPPLLIYNLLNGITFSESEMTVYNLGLLLLRQIHEPTSSHGMKTPCQIPILAHSLSLLLNHLPSHLSKFTAFHLQVVLEMFTENECDEVHYECISNVFGTEINLLHVRILFIYCFEKQSDREREEHREDSERSLLFASLLPQMAAAARPRPGQVGALNSLRFASTGWQALHYLCPLSSKLKISRELELQVLGLEAGIPGGMQPLQEAS